MGRSSVGLIQDLVAGDTFSNLDASGQCLCRGDLKRFVFHRDIGAVSLVGGATLLRDKNACTIVDSFKITIH
jgi:hypothetical protein